jgi:hypothetical protein
MNDYYVTFCYRNPRKRGWVRIQASSYDNAFKLASAKLFSNFRQIYEESDFVFKNYPDGEFDFWRSI